MANLNPSTTNFAGYKHSNYIINPPEGTTKGKMPNNMRNDVIMPNNTQAGLSFSTSMYQQGISPWTF